MKLQLQIPDMACSACVNNITQAIQEIDTNANINADVKTKVVSIETQQSETAIKEAVIKAGYTIA